MANIEFVLSRSYPDFLNEPVPTIQSLPEWYKKADKYNDNNTSTYKNCVSFFDGMSVGYTFCLPCDIKFFNENGNINFKIDEKYLDFISKRPEIKQFHSPKGYSKNHFAWFPEWGVSLEEGYSALYITPINRFDLPFINTEGIIDNDKIFMPGFVPFFIKEDFEGVILKGTPYMQIIPFKRENWTHSFINASDKEIKHFSPGGERKSNNIYRENLWERKIYK